MTDAIRAVYFAVGFLCLCAAVVCLMLVGTYADAWARPKSTSTAAAVGMCFAGAAAGFLVLALYG